MINFKEWVAKKNEAFGPYGREETRPQLSAEKLKKIFDITVQNLRDTWRKISYDDAMSEYMQLKELVNKIMKYDDERLQGIKSPARDYSPFLTLKKIEKALAKKRTSNNFQQDSGSDALAMAEKIWSTYQGK